MGNICCRYGRRRHRGSNPPQPPYRPQYPNPNSNPHPPPYQNPNHALMLTHHQHHRVPTDQKTVTVKNNVNLKKETLKIEADQQNSGKFLVSFTFDAYVACRITLYFFVKEGDDCNLTTTREKSGPPITVNFEQGLGQMFRHGIDFSAHEEAELLKGETDEYPLAVKAEATPGVAENGNTDAGVANSQITLAVFVKDKGEYQVRVMKQILWVNGTRYELQEILGIGNSVDGNDPGKECVVCSSKPRDTIVLPCRHLCMCSGCAKVLRLRTNRCPICRQPIERLLEIKV